MRTLIIAALILLTPLSALAGDWARYENGRFAYGIDVPAGFTWGRETDNGDGRTFRDGATRLAVWGANHGEDSFESAAYAAIGLAGGDGWQITYEAVTPSWASFSGTQGKRVLYQRMVALCDGQYAAFRLEYPATDLARLDPVVDHMVRSLTGSC
ncbi:hypothetical protein PRN20_05510 [Devosia sp. ZB163]|uniref:hypothetical protein n=1 Tax=Devosia sp. ZB163 TaxID=3025938 RepID=UPI0023623138|nr:hypothetical protein [Devosia sp. ZB163]MDC9823183.1 hypothetical protein [Devosia sp. ZB163]